MANLTKWSIDAAWTAVSFTATQVNSLASGSCVVSSAAITNNTLLDMYYDFSFVVTVGGTTTASSYLTLYVLPLNQDGTTYGDGVASGATLPVASYLASQVYVKSGVASGSTIAGTFPGPLIIRPTSFKIAIGNQLGVALNATASLTMKYQTYLENLNA